MTVVYTIGDVLSFTEFIMALRRILADREDIYLGWPQLLESLDHQRPPIAGQDECCTKVNTNKYTP